MLQGRYQIEQEIGAGAHGKVYRGLDTVDHTPVAIKRLRPGLVAAEPEILNRFRREADALRRLNHPNIVHALAAFAEGDDQYIVMEYLSGGSLRALLDETPCLPLERALRLALDLSDALARAHRLSIIHRDLKPANVLIAEDGSPRLTDFGVALIRDQERMTDSHSIVGTLNYIAPEALNGDGLDESADIWSFGVMFYEMLAGRRPFVTDNPTTLIAAILTQHPADLEELRPDAPPALVDLVYRMLDKNPRSRISSVRRVGVELEAILRQIETGELSIVTAEPSPDMPPPITTTHEAAPHIKNNLPLQVTPFVGRDWEIEELLRMLRPAPGSTLPAVPRPRLLTVLAPGGMGKSRLSLEVAARLLDTLSGTAPYPDGVYFVALAPLTESERIPYAIAEAVGYLMQADGREPGAQIESFLSDRRVLLILDNFEHLIAGGADQIAHLLTSLPNLTLLITSRERLNLSAEHLFMLDGLDTPADSSPSSPMEYSAVQLFVQSAQRSHPQFKLQSTDLPYVTTICHLVQGLPLGIVLAATWAEMLTVKEIAEELGKSAEFLEANMQDMPARHRSMRAVFEYSWQRLGAAEQRTLARLSVFRGAFSRAAAQAVTGASLRDLMLLVNKSLLHRDTESGYYNLHELIRQFAEGQLKTQDSDYQAALDAHARYYCSWLKELTPAALGPQMKAVLPMDEEIDNIRQAWQRAVARRDVTAIGAAEQTLYIYYRLRSLEGERHPTFGSAIEALEELPTSPERDRTLGRLYSRQAELYMRLAELEKASKVTARSLDLLRSANDEEGLIFTLAHQGEIVSRLHPYNDESSSLAEEGLSLARKHGLTAYEAMIELWLAFRANRDYNTEEGLFWTQKAYEHFRQVQQPEGQGDSLRAMGMLYIQMGDAQKALEKHIAARPHYEAIGDWAGVSACDMNECQAYNFLGRYAEAREAGLRSLKLMDEMGMDVHKPDVHTLLGDTAYLEGDYETSSVHLIQGIALSRHSSVAPFRRVFPMAYQARTLIALKRLDEADTLLTQVEAALIPGSGFRAFPMRTRGEWYAVQGRYDDAQAQHIRIIEHIFEDRRDLPALSDVLLGLAKIWHQQGRTYEAVTAACVVRESAFTWQSNQQAAASLLKVIRPTLSQGEWSTLEAAAKALSIRTYAESLLEASKG